VLAAVLWPSLLFALTTYLAQAGSATWNADPTSSDWNTTANWTPATVPSGPADTATFATSDTLAISLSSNTEVDGITYTAGASVFNITPAPEQGTRRHTRHPDHSEEADP